MYTPVKAFIAFRHELGSCPESRISLKEAIEFHYCGPLHFLNKANLST